MERDPTNYSNEEVSIDGENGSPQSGIDPEEIQAEDAKDTPLSIYTQDLGQPEHRYIGRP